MAGNHLRARKNWQAVSGIKAKAAEGDVTGILSEVLDSNKYEVITQPTNLAHIYENVKLSNKVLSEIFNPGKKYIHGIKPDGLIKNKNSGKSIYIEIKRQDGWVEGKKSSAGRGNAHERSNKFFTPGLLNTLREYTKIKEPDLPFVVIFIGDITRDPKRVREVTLWYGDKQKHFFMWRDTANIKLLEEYIINYVLKLID